MSSIPYRKHTPRTSLVFAALALLLLAPGSGRPVAAAPGAAHGGQTAVSGKPLAQASQPGRRSPVKGSTQRAVAAAKGAIFLPLVANLSRSQRSPAQEVLDLINDERALRGCRPLRLSNRLASAADGHSHDMAVNDFFDHTSPDGSTLVDRVEATGYDFVFVAENLAAGYPTPQSVFDGWMESPGHRANMLHCSLEETGIGYYYLDNDRGSVNYHYYWTQVLATPMN